MNKLWLVILITISILLVPNFDSGQSQAYREPVFKLDHFKAYNIDNVKAKPPKEVTINDQFLIEPVKFKPELIKFLILPVEKKIDKKISPIIDKQHHLAWYRVKRDTKPIKFEFSNQFTNFKFTTMVVKKLRALLVPTVKIKKGSYFPKDLDHYLCYQRLEGERTSKKVILTDQL